MNVIEEGLNFYGLSFRELLFTILKPGWTDEKARKAVENFMDHFQNDYQRIWTAQTHEIKNISLWTEQKAFVVKAAFSINQHKGVPNYRQIRSSKDCFYNLCPYLQDRELETFVVMFLNRANKIIKIEHISKGGTAGTVVDGKVIVKLAVQNNATSVILGHNHPSGTNKPSQADIDITKKLSQGLAFLDIALVDHIIVAGDEYYSFADNGMI